MTEPMAPERLAQIRACSAPPFDDPATQVVYGTIQELLAEVDRLRDRLESQASEYEAAVRFVNEQCDYWQEFSANTELALLDIEDRIKAAREAQHRADDACYARLMRQSSGTSDPGRESSGPCARRPGG